MTIDVSKMQSLYTSCIPVRVVTAILMFGGTFVSYVLRVNLNIAIVTMTNNSEVLCVNKSKSDRQNIPYYTYVHEILFLYQGFSTS